MNHNKPSQVACQTLLFQWQERKEAKTASQWPQVFAIEHSQVFHMICWWHLEMYLLCSETCFYCLLQISEYGMSWTQLLRQKYFMFLFSLWLSRSVCFPDCKSFDCATQSKSFEISTHFTKVLWLPQHRSFTPDSPHTWWSQTCSLYVTSLLGIWATLLTSHINLTKPICSPPFRAPFESPTNFFKLLNIC